MSVAIPQRSQFAFPFCALVFAVLLGVQALWLLVPELARPRIPFFPVDRASAESAAEHRGLAGFAAEVGVVRGDLWADYALALSAGLLDESGDVAESTRNVAITAAKLVPTDSRMWLLLALIDQRRDQPGHGISGPLKMSYYTGPNAMDLIPTRLQLAVSSTAINDPELQDLVTREIRTIVTRRPELRPALLRAHRAASSEGRRFIEAKVGDLDRNLLASLRAGGSPADANQTPQGTRQRGTGAPAENSQTSGPNAR
jgi:hypothetical protein